MPNFSKIPEDKNYTIELDGKTVATFCNKCRRFTKGNKQHSTSEHKGGTRFRPKSGKSMMAQVSQTPSTFLASSSEPVCAPIQAPTSYAMGPPLARAGMFYAANLAEAPTPSVEQDADDDDVSEASLASVDHRLLATLGYPKGLGRQG